MLAIAAKLFLIILIEKTEEKKNNSLATYQTSAYRIWKTFGALRATFMQDIQLPYYITPQGVKLRSMMDNN